MICGGDRAADVKLFGWVGDADPDRAVILNNENIDTAGIFDCQGVNGGYAVWATAIYCPWGRCARENGDYRQ